MPLDQAASPAPRLPATQSGSAAPLPQVQHEPQEAPQPSRRAFLGTLARVAGLAVLLPSVSRRVAALPNAALPNAALPNAALPNVGAAPLPGSVAGKVLVYKDPSCGCCNEWVKHMQKAGFIVTTDDTVNMDAQKKRLGVPASLASCHTAVVDDYLLEGHVPADLVQRMLREKPAARGLAVPGMPNGSPGMEGPTKDKYDVMIFDRLGKAKVYASR